MNVPSTWGRALGALALAAIVGSPLAAQDRPNILVIWGDDIGQSNISAYTMGVMHGYRTPNIDRIADEGMIFTDYYGEQSVHRGASRPSSWARASFGPAFPKSDYPVLSSACAKKSRRLRVILKELRLRDGAVRKEPPRRSRPACCPTNHGFDEFFGNLYHLNAEEEPENEDYPGDMVPRGRHALFADEVRTLGASSTALPTGASRIRAP